MLPRNLSLYAGIVEQDLEYTLSLISSMKAADRPRGGQDMLPELKAGIKSDLKDYSPKEVIRATEFMCLLESIYNVSTEICANLLEGAKYPPINFDYLVIPA